MDGIAASTFHISFITLFPVNPTIITMVGIVSHIICARDKTCFAEYNNHVRQLQKKQNAGYIQCPKLRKCNETREERPSKELNAIMSFN